VAQAGPMQVFVDPYTGAIRGKRTFSTMRLDFSRRYC